MKAPAELVSGEERLPGSYTTLFSSVVLTKKKGKGNSLGPP